MHIGLVGGVGPAASVFYYQRIERAFAKAGKQLHLTMVHTSAYQLFRNIAAGRAAEQADEFLRVTRQMQAAGASVVVIPAMGGHFCSKEFAAQSPLPMIDGPETVVEYLEEQGIRRIGVLGTRIVMETHLFGTLGQFDPIAPEQDELVQVNDDYVAVALASRVTAAQSERLLAAGRRLVRERGADAILLGGTVLNIVYDNANLGFSVIDSAAVHADAVIDIALGG